MTKVPRLHIVTDRSVLLRHDLHDLLSRFAALDATALHLRDRRAGGRRLGDLAVRAREEGLPCLINDRADVALAARAAGVHLPADGLSVEQARDIMGTGLVGRSTHSGDEAAAALESGADYVFLGPVWPTVTHPGHPGLGIEALAAVGDSRVIPIGGVTAQRIPECLAGGARGVAVITAVWGAPDPAAAAERMRVLLDS